VRHESREGVTKSLPCHVTLPVLRSIGSLRKWRIVHYSIQDDHAHLLIETTTPSGSGAG
jgi:hypothetical protein